MDTMSRAAKGRVAPPPRLGEAAQAVATAVAQLPDVVAQAHWQIGSQTVIDGADFYVGEAELGHIHLDGEAHIPLGKALAKRLIAAKLARRFPWSSDFVVVETTDGANAVRLFELRRAQIAGATDADLIAQLALHD
jgi:hypothetical protein